MRKRSLFKYFSNRAHASSFLEGEVFFRNLAFYRDYEDEQIRADKNEGASIFSPSEGLQINNLTRSTSTILPEFSFSSTTRQKDIFIFCLSQTFNSYIWDNFKAVSCIEIENIAEFCRRVEASLPESATYPNVNGRHRIGHRVQYYHKNEASNPRWALPELIATSKSEDYAWQNEFRLVFSNTNAFEFENVELRLRHNAHQDVRCPEEHQACTIKSMAFNDIAQWRTF